MENNKHTLQENYERLFGQTLSENKKPAAIEKALNAITGTLPTKVGKLVDMANKAKKDHEPKTLEKIKRELATIATMLDRLSNNL